MKKQLEGSILENSPVAPGIHKMRLLVEDMEERPVPGQFVNLYLNQGALLLPRPISIANIDWEHRELTLIYQLVGKGTKALGNMGPGERLHLLGPLGRGFQLPQEPCHHVVVGGGIGIPPLLELTKQLKEKGRVTLLAGFRNEGFLLEEMEGLGVNLHLASEGGAIGLQGTVIDLLHQVDLSPIHQIYACGPRGMLQAVALWGEARGIPVQVSLEQRMACGIGACLVCTCKAKGTGQEGAWGYKRVCKDGPVFFSGEVVWE